MVERSSTARRSVTRLVFVVALGAGLAACSSSSPAAAKSNSSKSSEPTSTAAPAAASTATVDAAHTSLFGTVLVTSTGRTLYMLTADSPTASVCTGTCASVWPPLTVTGTPTAGSGVKASELGTITRSGGGHQVTYDGHPLYTFTKDTAAGQVNGEGINKFGGIWYVLSTSGSPVKAPIASGTTTTTSGGSGY
jgi:predicted lipoprotein with Yx(FWY)xxD motif